MISTHPLITSHIYDCFISFWQITIILDSFLHKEENDLNQMFFFFFFFLFFPWHLNQMFIKGMTYSKKPRHHRWQAHNLLPTSVKVTKYSTMYKREKNKLRILVLFNFAKHNEKKSLKKYDKFSIWTHEVYRICFFYSHFNLSIILKV